MKQLFKNIKAFTICLLVVSFLGCEDDDTNLPEVISGFTFTLNEEIATVTFINISEEATAFEWDFGDGETSTLINPIKTYKESGTYTVTLEASNVAGASKVFEDEITIVILDPVTLPITFDSTTVDYTPTVFGGTSFEIVANPDASGSNTSTGNVGAITNGGNAFEGLFFDLGIAIDFTTDKSITMDFWSETPVDLLLKLEEGTSGDIEVVASHQGTGWEEITFDFDSDASYSKFTFFVDGPGTTTGDFFIDDIAQVATAIADSGCTDTPVAAATLPLNFEGCDTFASEFNFGAGISSELAPNPAKGGINDSDFVLKVDKPVGSDFFAGIQNTFANNFDLTTTNAFKIKVYSSKANTVFRFELALNPQTDPVTGNPAPVFVTVPNSNEWTEVEVVFTGLPGGPTAYNQLVIKPDNAQGDPAITEGGTYYFDDLILAEAGSGGNGGTFDDGLLTNGDFENGADPWTIGVGTDPVPVVTEGNNSFYSVDVTVAGNAFDVNMSQKLEIVDGSTYTLTFDAWSDRGRSVVVGIGLSGGSFANTTETVDITTNRQTYTSTLTAAGFGAPDARVLFDSGAEVGLVNIDNVSLVLEETGASDTEAPTITLIGESTIELVEGDTFNDPGATANDNVDGDISDNIVVGGDTVDINTIGSYIITYNVSDAAGNAAAEIIRTVIVVSGTGGAFDDGLLTNGDFENGAAPWIQGVDDNNPAPVVTENGNSFFSINVTNPDPGAPFAVNLSQKLSITPDATYTLSFDAWSDTNRSIIAGIGLSGGSFANTNEAVSITPTRDTYTVTLTAAGFGDATSRVLFDLNGEAGLVNIDNVSLVLDDGNTGGGTGGGCTDTLVAATALPLDFEGCETFLASQNFGAGLTSELVANPFKTGINTSDFVLQVDKPAGSDFFAGVQNTFASNFDLTTTDTFKVKVYSTKANVVFRFELALNPQTDPVTGNPAPVFVTIPNANEWIEVEVTFTGLPGGPTAYNQFVIKPDNAQGDPAITADGTYYIDDIILE